ncbi:MAG: hypothetical protein RL597_1532 [Pseudomonadota bacterium]
MSVDRQVRGDFDCRCPPSIRCVKSCTTKCTRVRRYLSRRRAGFRVWPCCRVTSLAMKNGECSESSAHVLACPSMRRRPDISLQISASFISSGSVTRSSLATCSGSRARPTRPFRDPVSLPCRRSGFARCPAARSTPVTSKSCPPVRVTSPIWLSSPKKASAIDRWWARW